jgi:hypothetical protein
MKEFYVFVEDLNNSGLTREAKTASKLVAASAKVEAI